MLKVFLKKNGFDKVYSQLCQLHNFLYASDKEEFFSQSYKI